MPKQKLTVRRSPQPATATNPDALAAECRDLGMRLRSLLDNPLFVERLEHATDFSVVQGAYRALAYVRHGALIDSTKPTKRGQQ